MSRPRVAIDWVDIQKGDLVWFKSGPRTVLSTARRGQPPHGRRNISSLFWRIHGPGTVAYNLSDLRHMGVAQIERGPS